MTPTERSEAAARSRRSPFTLETTYDAIAAKDSAIAFTEQSYSAYLTMVTSARITYADSFGNPYETIYDDWYRRKSRWVVPKSLRMT